MSVSYGGDKITFDDGTSIASGLSHFRNRIINGAMEIDQRYAGSSNTKNAGSGDTYHLDRWLAANVADGVYTIQQISDAPSNFKNSLRITVTTADSSLGATQVNLIRQSIEGLNVSDLAWGTASAKTITLSFWVKSSLTGQFGGSLTNSDANRSRVYTYTINAANTWEYKTITIPGDTTGTWLTTNGVGIRCDWNLGTGSTYLTAPGSWNASNLVGATGDVNLISTLNATWQITGVQFEVGSYATTFERRPFGTELQLCQRYFEKSYDTTTAVGTATRVGTVDWNFGGMASYGTVNVFFRTTKRSSATVTNYDPDTTNTVGLRFWNGSSEVQGTGSRDGWYGSQNTSRWALGSTSQSNAVFHWTASAEL